MKTTYMMLLVFGLSLVQQGPTAWAGETGTVGKAAATFCRTSNFIKGQVSKDADRVITTFNTTLTALRASLGLALHINRSSSTLRKQLEGTKSTLEKLNLVLGAIMPAIKQTVKSITPILDNNAKTLETIEKPTRLEKFHKLVLTVDKYWTFPYLAYWAAKKLGPPICDAAKMLAGSTFKTKFSAAPMCHIRGDVCANDFLSGFRRRSSATARCGASFPVAKRCRILTRDDHIRAAPGQANASFQAFYHWHLIKTAELRKLKAESNRIANSYNETRKIFNSEIMQGVFPGETKAFQFNVEAASFEKSLKAALAAAQQERIRGFLTHPLCPLENSWARVTSSYQPLVDADKKLSTMFNAWKRTEAYRLKKLQKAQDIVTSEGTRYTDAASRFETIATVLSRLSPPKMGALTTLNKVLCPVKKLLASVMEKFKPVSNLFSALKVEIMKRRCIFGVCFSVQQIINRVMAMTAPLQAGLNWVMTNVVSPLVKRISSLIPKLPVPDLGSIEAKLQEVKEKIRSATTKITGFSGIKTSLIATAENLNRFPDVRILPPAVHRSSAGEDPCPK